jgi:hypothetical protein
MSVEVSPPAQRWLLLIHQLPTKPAYFRVKVWRRLQGIGAIAVKSTVYALPATAEAQEDFAWLLREIVEGGGEAIVCEARLINGLSDDQARLLFDTARDLDYEAVAKEARTIAAKLNTTPAQEDGADARAQVRRLRKRLADIVTIDFFGATGRLTAESLIAELEARIAEDQEATLDQVQTAPQAIADLRDRIWVTRQGVHVDRMACAWLIRRFIDPNAVIRFMPGKGYIPKDGELRFDMFEGEFTHEGDRCSFEVLLSRARLSDPALQAIGQIVHDIDLKDGKFGRDEATGIAHVIAGIAMANQDDEQRIAQSYPIFDNLYQYFRKKRG